MKMIKKKNTIIIASIMVVFLINLISAVPKIEPYVNDFAGTMNQDNENEKRMD